MMLSKEGFEHNVRCLAEKRLDDYRYFVLVHEKITSRNINGNPSGGYYYAEFIDRTDIQKPLGYCKHRHKTRQAAEKCGGKHLRAVVEDAIKAELSEPPVSNVEIA